MQVLKCKKGFANNEKYVKRKEDSATNAQYNHIVNVGLSFHIHYKTQRSR